ncbi:hypothetical protein MJH12_20260 [bacterium]|nr:hypothetical protein [bacterium]
MNKITALLLLLLLTQVEAKDPKYIFFFIGDGMGLGQRSIAEIFKNAQKQINQVILLFE